MRITSRIISTSLILQTSSNKFCTHLERKLEGKVAVITGAASGIGKETAAKFISHGAKVIVADIQRQLGQQTANELGQNATFMPCDVTNESDVSGLVDFAVSKHAHLDIMYNNAGLQTKTGYKGFYMNANGPQINHLTFADDTIIFYNGDKRSLKMILDTLKKYEDITGQLINRNKSCFSLKSKASLNTITRMKRLPSMVYHKFPIKYLGCPLIIGKKKNAYYNDIVNKAISRIRGWHAKFLSPGGRSILIRHVLLALPTHLLSVVNPPKGTFELIEKCLARFFWSGNETGIKHHWISWDSLCYPFEEGGANFRRIEDICNAFKSKQWWKLRTSKSLWSEFMRAKYCSNQHSVKVQWTRGNSHYWKDLCGIKHNIEKSICWRIGKGDVSFWFDNWSDLGPLYLLHPNDNSHSCINLNSVLIEGPWHWDTLQFQLPTEDKIKISIMGIHLDNNKEDYPIWTDTATGEFSTRSAWDNIRLKKEINVMAKNIWNKDVPFKMTFLTWRAIQDRLPTDERVNKKFGISIDPGCHYCNSDDSNSNIENINHLFCHGLQAKRIWNWFAGPLGIGHRHNTLKMILLSWWNLKAKNHIVAFITKVLPPIICWELWRTRCSSKFEAIKPSFFKTKTNIIYTLLQVTQKNFGKAKIGDSWNTLCQTFEAKINQRTFTRVKWLKPPGNFIKLNSDGSCVNGSCGGGGLIRNSQGNMMFAYSLGLGPGTSNMAEAQALLYGLKWCVSKGYDRVWGETDSLLLAKCINKEWKTPWRLEKLIKETQQLVEDHGFIISHCFREANKPADKLASGTYSIDAVHDVNSFSDLPREVRGLINTDRWELPSFRIQLVKSSNLIYEPPLAKSSVS